MRFPHGNALPIKALFSLAASSASSTYEKYACGAFSLNIIFDLEMVQKSNPLEMVQEIKDVKNKKSPGFEAFLRIYFMKVIRL